MKRLKMNRKEQYTKPETKLKGVGRYTHLSFLFTRKIVIVDFTHWSYKFLTHCEHTGKVSGSKRMFGWPNSFMSRKEKKEMRKSTVPTYNQLHNQLILISGKLYIYN